MTLAKKGVTQHEQEKIKTYLRNYKLTDDSIIITRVSNKRRVYLKATDQSNIDYKIPFTYIEKGFPNPPNFNHSIDRIICFRKMSKRIYQHKGKYDYALVKNEDLNRRKKVTLICKINTHGEFKVRYDLHLYNALGCPECGKIKIKRIRKY